MNLNNLTKETLDLFVQLIVFMPFLGAFIVPVISYMSSLTRNLFSLFLVLTSFLLSFALIPHILYIGNISIEYQTGVGTTLFLVDKLGLFMALCSSMIGSIIVLYSFGYIASYQNQNEYYLMVVLFLGSMMGLVFSSNLIIMFIFWEVTAFVCWRLIGFFRDKDVVLKADKAFLVTVFGAVVMLLGFILIYHQTGSFDIVTIKKNLNGGKISDLAVILILFGILSKSATLPLHTWLPDAGVAPSPVTALLHAAVLVKIGVYVYARLFVVSFPIETQWHTIIPMIAAVSALVSGGAALIENNMKRIIAYSTISQIAFIFLGLASGTAVGVAGGMLYILMHGLSKGGLFLCAGIVEHQTHTKDINKLGGLIKVMPYTAAAFILCSLSVMGLPPFGGFFSKYMVIAGTIDDDRKWIAATFIFGAVLTVVYLMRLFTSIFMGPQIIESKREGSKVMVFSVMLLGILSVLSGVFIYYPSFFVNTAVEQIFGMVVR